MGLPCEQITKEILPSIRALITKKLISDYRMSQTKISILLGITQPAVSQYRKETRAKRHLPFEDVPEIMNMINSLAERAARGELKSEEINSEFCKICKLIRETEFVHMFKGK